MTAPAFSLCVYCGSRHGVEPAFTEVARQVGHWIGRHGGRVVGVIPHALVEREWAKRDCTELHIVDNMHERKRMMAERADAFLALPGGIGTFEEFFEAWTWKQLGYHAKPIGLLNTGGYYQPLLDFLDASVKSGFMSEWQMGLLAVGGDVATLLPQLVQAAGMSPQRMDLTQI